jgi:hypothetical protein
LDEEGSSRLAAYDLYRSEEISEDRPIIDGFYVQRGFLSGTPQILKITLEIPQ